MRPHAIVAFTLLTAALGLRLRLADFDDVFEEEIEEATAIPSHINVDIQKFDPYVKKGDEALAQPDWVFEGCTKVGEAIKKLEEAADTPQKKLINWITELAKESKMTKGYDYIIYNPGVKSEKSMQSKAYRFYLDAEQKRNNGVTRSGSGYTMKMLNDVYRGSIVLARKEQVDSFMKKMQGAQKGAQPFEVVTFKDRWDPKNDRKDGYKDINMRVRDIETGLIGEFQINLCVVKKFTNLAGHMAYEIVRDLKPSEKKDIEPLIDQVTKFGFDSIQKYPEIGCIPELLVSDVAGLGHHQDEPTEDFTKITRADALSRLKGPWPEHKAEEVAERVGMKVVQDKAAVEVVD